VRIVFEDFSDRAHELVRFAQEEARELGHPYIGAQHLLLGGVRVGAAGDLSADEVRAAIVAALGSGEQVPEWIRFTTPAQLALERARSLAGPRSVLPAHVLLALLEDESVISIVVRCGGAPDRLRAELAGVTRDTRTDERHPVVVTIGDELIGDLGHPRTDVRMLAAILRRDGRAAGWLRSAGIDEAWVREFGGD
jgi:hypothetical protein